MILEDVERGETVLDSGLTYDGITPVLVHVTRREGRFEFSDGGGAVAAAGVRPSQLRFDDRIVMGDYERQREQEGRRVPARLRELEGRVARQAARARRGGVGRLVRGFARARLERIRMLGP